MYLIIELQMHETAIDRTGRGNKQVYNNILSLQHFSLITGRISGPKINKNI